MDLLSFGGPYENSAIATAQSPGGSYVFDYSGDGIIVIPEDDTFTPVTFFDNPVIGIAKNLTSVADNGDGTKTIVMITVIILKDVRWIFDGDGEYRIDNNIDAEQLDYFIN